MTLRKEDWSPTSESASLASLFGGDLPAVTHSIALAPGSGTLVAGTVLAKLTKDTVAISVPASGNAGNATLTSVAVTLGVKAKPGRYRLRCTGAATNAGTFEVRDPDGYLLPPLTVAAAYSGDHINLTLPDGSTDWAAGDLVYVDVSGSGHWVAYDDTPAAYDGRDVAARILAHGATLDDTDTTAAQCYRSGMFREGALTGIDAAGKADLDLLGIYVR